MGTTISAVSLMLVMAIGIASVQNTGTTASTPFALMGHFEIMVENLDGTTSYVQTDNFINGLAKTNVGEALFEGVALNQPNDCTILGTGTPTNADDGITAGGILATTGVACSDDVAPNNGSINCDGLGDSVILTAENCVIVTVHTTDAADCNPCDIDEAAIINTGAVAFARNTFAPVGALGPDDALEIDWTFTFTGAAE